MVPDPELKPFAGKLLSADDVPNWRISSDYVVRARALIRRGYLRTNSTSALAQHLDVSPTRLRDLFVEQLGVSPKAYGDALHKHIQSQIKVSQGLPQLRFRLPVRKPFDARWVFEFLAKRALPGLEEAENGCYRRRLQADAWLSVRYVSGALEVSVPRACRARSAELLGRVAHVFDTGADPKTIDRKLREEPWLAGKVTGGIRVPGAWDGFETAVRAILGQQVSVARARNLAIDLMHRFGEGDFPTPEALVDADVSAIGMPGKRGEAVRALAKAVVSGELTLDNGADADNQFAALCALPGIGPWTAGYVAMRIGGDANAFPRGDWVILKQLDMTAAVAERYSQAWAPWRSYALMYIWQAS